MPSFFIGLINTGRLCTLLTQQHHTRQQTTNPLTNIRRHRHADPR